MMSYYGSLPRHDTYQIPAAVLDISQFVFGHNSPYALRNMRVLLKGKVKLDLVLGTVGQLDNASENLVGQLEEIVVWAERDGGMQ
jgi:hypothetical protein